MFDLYASILSLVLIFGGITSLTVYLFLEDQIWSLNLISLSLVLNNTMEILFFSSPIGLGHASRDLAIAEKLKYDITFVSGKPASEHLSSNDFNVMDLYRRKDLETINGEFRNRISWLIDYVNYYRDCKVKAREVIVRERPQIIISDEDFAAIALSIEMKIPRILITDIFESRFTNGIGKVIEYFMNRSLKSMLASSDLVIIPFEGEDYNNFAFVGPIARSVNASREELRRKFGFRKKTILVSVGGTSAGKFLLNHSIEVLKKFEYDVVIVSGPSITPVQITKSINENIKYYGYVKDLHEMIYASDLLISLAGRSTIDEARIYGTPAIFIPIKGHFEQEENAQRYGFRLDDIYRLEEFIPEYIGKRRKVLRNGVDRASELINAAIVR